MLILPEGATFRFKFDLKDCDGAAIPLTGYQTAVVKAKRPSPAAQLVLTATVTSEAYGTGYADAAATDMVGVGDWSAWAVVTWADGRVVKSHGVAFRVVAEGTPVTGTGC
jgi:hypothetical protein